ncbi:MAG: hypothetical protein GYA14_11600 [Ignavibacteria bacterium]|nr:hypothetical protein [Ignavibacteria bacterium]
MKWKIKFIKATIYVVLFFFDLPLSAQTFFGLHLEPITYLANVEKVQYNPNAKTKELSIEGNLGITFSLTHYTDEKIGISLRPGIMLGYIYFGYDLVLFWAYQLDSDMYVMSGINGHFNLGRAASNSALGKSLLFPFLVVGGGYKISEGFLAEIQFNLSLKNETYGWIRNMEGAPTYKTEWNYYQVPWLIKVSLAHKFEI